MRALTFSLFAAVALAVEVSSRADIVNVSNGDRFVGSVELVNAAEVHLKSDTLGLVKIPRHKVQSIYFGTNQPPAATIAASTAPKNELGAAGFDPKAVEKVQGDFLATAGPEANAMFKDLIQGLSQGKLNQEDIRKQAEQSLKELKELQAELGEEADNPIVSNYAAILERFVKQGATNGAKATLPKTAPAEKPTSDE
jgi:hypothetical protein